jgi:NADH-quinone oxidoreductase subunit N
VNTPTFTLNDFLPVLPALVMSVAAIVLMLSEAFLSSATRTYQAMLAVIASTIAGGIAFTNAQLPLGAGDDALRFQGFVVLDAFSSWMTVMVCVGSALAALLAAGFLKHRNAERGEFYALMLFAASGMSLLALSAEFITLFINLEVMSIATYALTAFLRRGPRPAEAGFKYFILGAFASSLLLYGAALLYGATGTTKLVELGRALPMAYAASPGLVKAGFGLVLAGFAFKVGAVPFHMWVPDVYEGAPTPVTALMSAGTKAAAFVSLVRVFTFLVKGFDPQIPFLVFSALAAATMVGGNLMAMPQRNVKRLLAYSSVAHAGYLLLGVAAIFAPQAAGHANGALGSTPLLGATPSVAAEAYKGILFYLLGYTVTAIGAFGTISALERREDETRANTWDLEKFAGLAQRKPGWAAAMAIFLLSLAGIPPTVGFLGKLLLFGAAVDAGLVWLAVIGVLSAVVGAYYYLRVVLYMYMRPVPADAVTPFRAWTTELALALSAIAVVGLGIIPGPVTAWFSKVGLVFGGG